MTQDGTRDYSPVANTLDVYATLPVLGTARSGTTAIGMLMASASGAHYINEPHTLAHLLNVRLRGEIPDLAFRELLRTYLFWDLLLPVVTGRAVNTNRHDQTWAGNWLGEAGLSDRLGRSWRFIDVADSLRQQTLIVKMVDQTAAVTGGAELFGRGPLFIVRDPQAVISSCLRRGYYSSPDTAVNAQPVVVRRGDGTRIPVHVPDDLIELWLSGSQIDRCAISSLAFYRALQNAQTGLVVNYSSIHPDKGGQGRRAMIALGLTPTAISDVLERGFAPPATRLGVDWSDMHDSLRAELRDAWSHWQRLTRSGPHDVGRVS